MRAEAQFQTQVAALGYPVPEVVAAGPEPGGGWSFTERSAGPSSLHDLALADTRESGRVSAATCQAAAGIGAVLLSAQARHTSAARSESVRAWFAAAGWTASVFAENPDLDTPHTHQVAASALRRLEGLRLCRSHLDYGLPNAYPAAVIDWQHHALAPLGYDVYPALEIVPFKGGNKGYTFTAAQRTAYLERLDAASTGAHGQPLSTYLGEFLLAKCFFFLALMRPTNPEARPDKHIKWQYRRALFREGLAQYEHTGTIDTESFPTLADFTQHHPDARRP